VTNFRDTAAFTVLVFALACFAAPAPDRVDLLSRKVLCTCGCREMLAECSHASCERKPGLRKEISDAVTAGKADDEILQQFAALHGSDLLLTPAFQGFDTLLWIVPVVGAVIATGLTLRIQRKRKLPRE
jgi:cytochrome c-type biogenesis protein CcmH